MSESQGPDPGEIASLLEDAPHVDDAGFSDRVIRALPRGRARAGSLNALLAGFTAIACGLAYALGGRSFGPGHGTGALSLAMTSSFAAVALALVVLAAATLLGSGDYGEG